MKSATIIISLTAFAFLASSCLSVGTAGSGRQGAYIAAAKPAAGPPARVMAAARSLLGQKPYAKVTVRGRGFVLDCIGTVSAAWWGAGLDIQRDFGKYQGNGVKRLYDSLSAWRAVSITRRPAPGDFIFWENTYDRNEDGKLYNDGLTHVGIVMAVDADGTVEYLHLSYSRGVALAWCNLDHPGMPFGPGGKVWNSPMFLGSSVGGSKNPPKWLSGDLWHSFGHAGPTAARLGD